MNEQQQGPKLAPAGMPPNPEAVKRAQEFVNGMLAQNPLMKQLEPYIVRIKLIERQLELEHATVGAAMESHSSNYYAHERNLCETRARWNEAMNEFDQSVKRLEGGNS